jgi:hypothetical protein
MQLERCDCIDPAQRPHISIRICLFGRKFISPFLYPGVELEFANRLLMMQKQSS